MRLLIIRHGDPDYAHDSLTEKGFREAELLSEKLKNENITKIYCSPLGRAKATAKPTVEKTGLEPEILDWLQEFPASVKPPYANADSCPWNLIPQYWTLQDKFYDRHEWRGEPLYEESNVPEVYDRVSKRFNELMAKHGYKRNGQIYDIADDADQTQTIALFCHLGLGLSVLSCITTGALPFMWESFFLPTTSVTTVMTEIYPRHNNKQAHLRVIGLGDVSHLYAGGEPTSDSGLHSKIIQK